MPLDTKKFPIFHPPPIHMSKAKKTEEAKVAWRKKFELSEKEEPKDVKYGT